MPAGTYDFTAEQGVGTSFTVEYRDNSGAAKDLTDWEARGHIKAKMSDCDPIAVFDITITDPINGKLKVALNSGSLEKVDIRTRSHNDYMSCVYDIELFKPGTEPEEVIRLLNGTVKISPEVTK